VADVTTAQRKLLSKMGVAMPDGSYYIRNAAELSDAIKAVGRATPNAGESDVTRRNEVRRHCIARAKTLNLSSMIPDTWNPDGSLKHYSVEEFIAHFGVKGMRWGVQRSRSVSVGANKAVGSKRHQVSVDANRAVSLKKTVRTHGTAALSNQDLQHLVTRLNLEKQYSQLNPKQVSTGRRIVSELGSNVARQQANTFANKYAADGISFLTKVGVNVAKRHIAKHVIRRTS
jgi:hypothetical protein